MADEEPALETRLSDEQPIDPAESFVAQANVADESIRETFEEEWPDCWERAGDLLEWKRDYDAVLDGGPPFRWFEGGRLNAAANCVDRHVEAGKKNRAAIKWEGRLGETRTYTYLDLYREINEFAVGLRELGVGEGDVVTLYLPMLPELPIAMLACARVGAPHNVVFAGFAADALATRMERTDSSYLVTCDGYYRRGSALNQKSTADNALLQLDHEVEHVVIVNRLGEELPLSALATHEHDYGDLIAAHRGATCDPVERAATDPLFHIYTSGTTGSPKGVTHTTGGYLAHVAWTSHAVLDIKPADAYWCSADIGWITGHSYIVYGPLALGTTSVMHEGAPDYPEKNRVWEVIERNAVDVFYTAPTAIRAFMKWGSEYPEDHDLSSLRLLGTVGEPITPSAWQWYYEHIGDGECPIVDTWWQTETGGMMVTTLPGVDAMKPGSVGPPLPGVGARVVDDEGDPVGSDQAGELVLDRPWPGMPIALAETDGREGTTGPTPDWTDRAGDRWYATGDGATVDADGYVTVLGRVDDVINVSGHRFGTMELESAIVDVDGVAEAAVVCDGHDGEGTDIYAYVTVERGRKADDSLRQRVTEGVESTIGPIARPDSVVFTPELPKTRSGKIMRRLLERIARDEPLGDTSPLRNPEIVGEIESATRE